MISTIADKIKAAALFVVDYFRTQPIVGFLVGLALVLFLAFFIMLGNLSPSSPGREVSLDQVLTAAKQRQVEKATILDEDARVEVGTRTGELLWAAYPSSEGQTARIIAR